MYYAHVSCSGKVVKFLAEGWSDAESLAEAVGGTLLSLTKARLSSLTEKYSRRLSQA